MNGGRLLVLVDDVVGIFLVHRLMIETISSRFWDDGESTHQSLT